MLSTMLRRALRRRCPVCGGSDLFTGWLRMRSACPTCGLPTVREHGQALATTTVNLVLTLSLMLGTLLVVTIATYPDIPVGPVAIVTLAMAVVLPLLFHPFAKTLWLAIDLRLNPLRPGEVSPEHELALLERHEDRGSG